MKALDEYFVMVVFTLLLNRVHVFFLRFLCLIWTKKYDSVGERKKLDMTFRNCPLFSLPCLACVGSWALWVAFCWMLFSSWNLSESLSLVVFRQTFISHGVLSGNSVLGMRIWGQFQLVKKNNYGIRQNGANASMATDSVLTADSVFLTPVTSCGFN